MGDVFDSGPGRVIAGISTGGLSEVARSGVGKGISSGIFGGKGKTGLLGTGGYEVATDPYYNEQTKSLADLLMAQIGQDPSSGVAGTQARQQLMNNLLAQQQGIRSIGGVTGANKQRMIGNAGAEAGQEIANASTVAGLQERNGSQELLANLLIGKNKNDISEQGLKLNEQQERAKRRFNAVEAGGQAFGSLMGGG